MDLKQICDEFVSQNVKNKDIAKYNDYLRINEKQEPILSGLHRGLKDILSVHAWTTCPEGQQNYLYFQMNGDARYCASLFYENGALCKTHSHNYIEMLYVMQGELNMQINGRTYTFSQGEICLINTNTMHSEYIYCKDSFIICLCTDDIIFDQYKQISSSTDYTLSLKKLINRKRSQYRFVAFSPRNLENSKTKTAFETIIQELMGDLPGKRKIIIGYVERIVDLLAREYMIHVTQSDKKELHQMLVRSISDYIEYHYDSVCVKDISEKFGYSPDYLTKIFREENKISISKYIQIVRIHHSFELIKTTSLPIEEISRKVGYNNVGFFYRIFKNYYGVTPAELRK